MESDPGERHHEEHAELVGRPTAPGRSPRAIRASQIGTSRSVDDRAKRSHSRKKTPMPTAIKAIAIQT